MKTINRKSLITVVAVAGLSLASIAGRAEAHGGLDYSLPVQLLLLNSAFGPGHHHAHHYSVIRKQVRHHRGGRHKHGRTHHRQHNHSRGGYRGNGPWKKQYRH